MNRIALFALALLAVAGCAEAHKFDDLEVGLIEERVRTITCQKTKTLTQSNGRFQHPTGRRRKYGNNEELCWIVKPEGCDKAKHDLVVSFPKLSIEEGYDFVQLAHCNGKVFEDDAEQKEYVVDDCCFKAHFSSDYSVTKGGFRIKYGIVDAAATAAPEETVVAVPDHKATGKMSKTEMYEGEGPLVARRGAGFVFGITGASIKSITMHLKNKKFAVKNGGGEGGFTATVKETASNDEPDVWTVNVGANAPVGCYTIDLSVGDTTNPHELDVCVIFNAYKSGLAEYVASASDRKNYLEQTQTMLYLGSYNSHGGKIWDLAWQKRENLVTYMSLLSALSVTDRGLDKVAREASYQIGRVVHGRWKKDFPGGEKPGFWTSSQQILEKYRETNEGVKYGQCWVFSAMLTSMMRSFGLASRSVTNFDSAHERPPYDGKCIKKWQCNEEGDCESAGGDSVWNFHVWVETLYKGHTGKTDWSAHDATPQEHSEGRYQCGPCAKNLMKVQKYVYGKPNNKWDCDFIYSEVDCDTYDHLHLHGGDVQKRKGDAYKVGRLTGTKPKGEISDRYGSRDVDPWDEPQNVASGYKIESGRLRFREMISKESKSNGPAGWTLKVNTGKAKAIKVGESIKFSVAITGNGKPLRVKTVCDVVTYDNKIIIHKGVLKELNDITAAKTIRYEISPKNYQDKIGQSLNFRCTAAGHTVGKAPGQDFWGRNFHFSLTPPTVKLSGRENTQMKKGQLLVAKFVYENPLQIPLKNLKFQAITTGSGVDKEMNRVRKSLDANGKWTVTLKIKSSAKGAQFAVVSVSSDQITAANGAFKFQVAPRQKTQKPQAKRKVRQKKKQMRKRNQTKAKATKKRVRKTTPQKRRRQKARKQNRKKNRANAPKRRKQKPRKRKKRQAKRQATRGQKPASQKKPSQKRKRKTKSKSKQKKKQKTLRPQ